MPLIVFPYRSRTDAGSDAMSNAPVVPLEAFDDAELPDLEDAVELADAVAVEFSDLPQPEVSTLTLSMPQMREELISIRGLLTV